MNKPIKILFLAANPKDTDQLRLDEEIRGIKQSLRQAEFRDMFEIEQEWAVRVSDLQGHLLRHKPDIVHFSGHGSLSSEIILEDNIGNSQPLSVRALSQLFSILKDNIRCVVLNACYSKEQAHAIAKHIDCVIGMSSAIGDLAAKSFSVAFYQALGFGRDVKTAFDLGSLQIGLESLDEQDIPKLFAININPSEVVFIQDMDDRGITQKHFTVKDKLPKSSSIAYSQATELEIESSMIPFDWVVIPAGYSPMGSDSKQDRYAGDNEIKHMLYLPEYCIARVPVTVAQFRHFITATHYKTTAEKQGWAADWNGTAWKPKKGAFWEHPHGPNSDVKEDHPVTCISWYDAVEFCLWAAARLPTEAEWEKAAGWNFVAQLKFIYPWGNELPDKSCCNFDMLVGDTTPVDRYPQNFNGLHDIDQINNHPTHFYIYLECIIFNCK